MRPATLTIHLGHLAYNYRLLQQQADTASIMAVVKANAYGHGLIPVSKALYQAGCRSFAVTDATEGQALREHIHQDTEIVVFSGVFDAEDAETCARQHLTPVITETQQLQKLLSVQFQGSVWLKVDTGMNRLGAEDLQALIRETEQTHIRIAGIMSHLASADTPEHPLNQQQISAFKKIQQQTHAPAYSLLNSAGMIAFASDITTQVVRPGIALYGIEPIPEQPLGLKPVMQMSSRIMQVRDIQKGDNVSYNATWSAPHDMRIAIVALGYADGLPRLLSNHGHLIHKSAKLPIVGRVCMDYSLLAVDQPDVQVGDEAYVFGYDNNLPQANHIAAQCQTITYEIFTGLGDRLSRRYIGEES